MFVALQLVDVVWLLLALVFLVAFIICKFSLRLPGGLENIFHACIRYGKTNSQTQQPGIISLFYVPKRWFWHFYAVSVFWNGLLLVFSLRTVFFHKQLPDFLIELLGWLTGQPKTAWSELKLTVLLLHFLLWLHSLRRLFECLYISIFSHGLINVVQYAFGLSYYILVGLTVLSVNSSLPTEESIHNIDQHLSFCVFVLDTKPAHHFLVPSVACTNMSIEVCTNDHSFTSGGASVFSFSRLTWYIAGLVFFLWASLLQHQSLALLASLRITSSGRVETLAHRIPYGCWFKLVSCPHYLAELLIYIGLSICCGCISITWWIVVLYVLCNQVMAAHLSHEYYRSTFKAYPSERKAIIPYLL